jgi:hypothetical protein
VATKTFHHSFPIHIVSKPSFITSSYHVALTKSHYPSSHLLTMWLLKLMSLLPTMRSLKHSHHPLQIHMVAKSFITSSPLHMALKYFFITSFQPHPHYWLDTSWLLFTASQLPHILLTTDYLLCIQLPKTPKTHSSWWWQLWCCWNIERPKIFSVAHSQKLKLYTESSHRQQVLFINSSLS